MDYKHLLKKINKNMVLRLDYTLKKKRYITEPKKIKEKIKKTAPTKIWDFDFYSENRDIKKGYSFIRNSVKYTVMNIEMMEFLEKKPLRSFKKWGEK